ncbi:D-ribose pyranase [Schinkia sp. CFF1]
MKKKGILNSQISAVLAELGHTDTIVIADCGLPISSGVKRIDIALKFGTPGFVETLAAVIDDMEVEQITLANEICTKNVIVKQEIEKLLPNKPTTYVDHEQFKQLTKNAKAIIRTGETTPYANIILQAGVIF